MQLLFRKLPTFLDLIGSYLSKNPYFKKVMRLVNFFMTIFGPVSLFCYDKIKINFVFF